MLNGARLAVEATAIVFVLSPKLEKRESLDLLLVAKKICLATPSEHFK